MRVTDGLFPEGLPSFLATTFGKVPYARPSVAPRALPLLTWDVLDDLPWHIAEAEEDAMHLSIGVLPHGR